MGGGRAAAELDFYPDIRRQSQPIMRNILGEKRGGGGGGEDDHFDTLVNPILIIEILSDSTERYDRGFKFLAYQAIPSLQEYVLITQSPRRFEIYRRQAGGDWHYESWAFSPPPLVLQSIGCTLSADDVYFKVEDDGSPQPQEPIDDETRRS